MCEADVDELGYGIVDEIMDGTQVKEGDEPMAIDDHVKLHGVVYTDPRELMEGDHWGVGIRYRWRVRAALVIVV